MISIFSREHLQKSLDILRSRFPFATLISVILTIYICYQIFTEVPGIHREGEILRTVTTLILTFFLSVGVTLWEEGKKGGKWKYALQIVPVVYASLYYLSFSYNHSWSMENMAFFLLHLAGFSACIFFAPFLTRTMRGGEYLIEYSNYFSRVSWTLLMFMIVGGSLFALGAIAIGSIDKLFDIGYSREYEKLYGYWAALSLALFAPLYGLVQFPHINTLEAKMYENNRFFAFMVKYIGVPFVLVYFAILYAYSGKVLLHFSEWPKGMIAWLVIGFSSLGYLVYIYSKPYEKEGRYITLFRKYFPYGVIPQIFMLAYAIALRIGQYGWTMNRYFVVAFGIWLTIISLYFVLSKKKKLIIVPVILSALSLLISVGPWSVFSYPKQDQKKRLMANLVQAKIVQDNKIVPLTDVKSLSKELSNEIYTQIEYLCNQDDCEYVKSLFPEQVESIRREEEVNWKEWNKDQSYTGPQSYQIISGVTQKIGVKRYYSYSEETQPKYISHSLKNSGLDDMYPIDISGYNTIVPVIEMSHRFGISPEKYPYLSFDSDTNMLMYHAGSGVTQNFPLHLSLSVGHDGDLFRMNQQDKEDMTYNVTGSGVEIRVIFQHIFLRNPSYQGKDDRSIGGASGIGLIKYVK